MKAIDQMRPNLPWYSWILTNSQEDLLTIQKKRNYNDGSEEEYYQTCITDMRKLRTSIWYESATAPILVLHDRNRGSSDHGF
jgi:hypothetical protein